MLRALMSAPDPAPSAPALGKLAPEAFARLVAPHLGAERREVLVGPRAGHDAAIVKLGGGRVLALTTDPLSVIPALGPARSARLAAHLVASDLWTTAVAPAWASVTLNLPPDFPDASLAEFTRALGEAWGDLGVAVVTGHTGRHEGCALTIVGAATLVGVGDEDAWLAPSMASPGDRVIVTKGCAVESAAVAAWLCPERVRAHAGDAGLARLRASLDDASIVRDVRALLAACPPRRATTALHDATEGGVLGGLLELAKACGHDVRVALDRVPLPADVAAACAALEIEPGWALAEGALVACVRPASVDAALAALHAAGIVAADVGEVVPGTGVLHVLAPDGGERVHAEPEPDPWWAAYDRAVREGWR